MTYRIAGQENFWRVFREGPNWGVWALVHLLRKEGEIVVVRGTNECCYFLKVPGRMLLLLGTLSSLQILSSNDRL